MSKKLFTLIYGDSIHIAPQTKIVRAEAFSKALEAQEVMEHIQKDVEKYRLEVAKECEKLKDRAQKEGYEAGFLQWAEHVAKLEEEIAKVRKDMESSILPIALKTAKKIVGREIELSPAAMVDIVANNLKAVSQHKKIAIFVNKSDLRALEASKSRLKALFEHLESLTIQARDDIKSGGCVIETEGGIINAQLENQWRVLEQAFEALIQKRKG